MAIIDAMRRAARGLFRRHVPAFALALAALFGGVSAGFLVPAILGEPRGAAAQPSDQGTTASACPDDVSGSGALPFVRTELFFGADKPDGTEVTEEEFLRFLDREITPRFPDGLTVLTGTGQFRSAGGEIDRERSMLVILLYPRASSKDSSRKIEAIRDAYEQEFQQESVLRDDDRFPSCVSF
jgi:hypothetical protein